MKFHKLFLLMIMMLEGLSTVDCKEPKAIEQKGLADNLPMKLLGRFACTQNKKEKENKRSECYFLFKEGNEKHAYPVDFQNSKVKKLVIKNLKDSFWIEGNYHYEEKYIDNTRYEVDMLLVNKATPIRMDWLGVAPQNEKKMEEAAITYYPIHFNANKYESKLMLPDQYADGILLVLGSTILYSFIFTFNHGLTPLSLPQPIMGPNF